MDQNKTMRIVLLGKTGTGKSSLCNTLFGEKVFEESSLANSVTHRCQSFTKTIDGRNIKLIDTPGFFDTEKSNDELKPELLRSIVKSAPGPHAFLLVFKIGRFTPQEEEIVNLMVNEYFGEVALKYTTVVFTHGDQLPEGMKIEDWVNQSQNKSLKKLLEKCQNRCCVFDNKYWNNNQHPYRNNKIQIKNLLEIIEQTVRYNVRMQQMMRKQVEEEKSLLNELSPYIEASVLQEIIKSFDTNEMKLRVKKQIQEKIKTTPTQDLPNIDNDLLNAPGSFYTNEMLQMVQQQIEEKKDQHRRSSPNMSEQSRSQTAKESVLNLLKNNWKGVAIGVILGAFLGGAAGAYLAYGASCAVTCTAAGAGAAVGTVVGGAVGAVVSEYAETLAKAAINLTKQTIQRIKELKLTVSSAAVELAKESINVALQIIQRINKVVVDVVGAVSEREVALVKDVIDLTLKTMQRMIKAVDAVNRAVSERDIKQTLNTLQSESDDAFKLLERFSKQLKFD